MINSRFEKEECIVYIQREGDIRIEDLFAAVASTISDYKDLKNLYVLDDKRGSKSIFSSSDYPALLKKIGAGLVHFQEVRHAILVDTPMNTALAILFERLVDDLPNYSFKTFSTQETALSWLKKGAYYDSKC